MALSSNIAHFVTEPILAWERYKVNFRTHSDQLVSSLIVILILLVWDTDFYCICRHDCLMQFTVKNTIASFEALWLDLQSCVENIIVIPSDVLTAEVKGLKVTRTLTLNNVMLQHSMSNWLFLEL